LRRRTIPPHSRGNLRHLQILRAQYRSHQGWQRRAAGRRSRRDSPHAVGARARLFAPSAESSRHLVRDTWENSSQFWGWGALGVGFDGAGAEDSLAAEKFAAVRRLSPFTKAVIAAPCEKVMSLPCLRGRITPPA